MAPRDPSGVRARTAGFTLVEMLVSTAIVILVFGAVVAIARPAMETFLTQPDVSDMQQRLRIAADGLTKDLLMAGAGTYRGPAARTLGALAASIVPRRLGAARPDADTIAASDRISILYVPVTSSQTTLRYPLVSAGAPIVVNSDAGCPVGQDACGFSPGMTVVVFDETGAHDTFTVTGVQGSVVQLRPHSAGIAKAYSAGALVSEVATMTYWLDRATAQLMKYDGDRTDLPLIDNVVSLRFEYFGEARAPRLIRPPTDPDGPWTTYGPRPPDLDADDPADSWGAGENCVFQLDAVTGAQTPRLPDLVGAADPLVLLTAPTMTDGPWCPDGASPNRFDADLLRIRLVRVTVRVQAARATLRGPAGPLFSRAGTARGAGRIVPDRELRFDVAPRGLSLGR